MTYSLLEDIMTYNKSPSFRPLAVLDVLVDQQKVIRKHPHPARP